MKEKKIIKTDEKTTIADVSKVAGVSKTTISRYLNGKYQYMSLETKERIEQVIEDLNYRPNFLARNLKSKKSGLIGVIVSDIKNYVMPLLIEGIMSHFIPLGYQVIVSSSGENPKKEVEYVNSMIDRQVEGLIVNTSGSNDNFLKSQTIPLVLADRTIIGNSIGTVTTNNNEITKETTKMLYEKGFTKVALFLKDVTKSDVRNKRYKAFLEEAQNKGLHSEHIFSLEEGAESYKKELLSLLNKKSVCEKLAIFAAEPVSLLHLLEAMQELNLEAPRDLGILGYDDLVWTRLIWGGISVVSQPFYEVGRESAKLLLDKINDEKNIVDYQELKSKLILRNSTLLS